VQPHPGRFQPVRGLDGQLVAARFLLAGGVSRRLWKSRRSRRSPQLKVINLKLIGRAQIFCDQKKWCACARAQTQKIMRSLCARDFFKNSLPEVKFFSILRNVSLEKMYKYKHIVSEN